MTDLRALLEAATPGRWEALDTDHVEPPVGPGVHVPPWVGRIREDGQIDLIADLEQENGRADAALIVAAVNSLPRLLDARDEIARLGDEAAAEYRDCREEGDRFGMTACDFRASAYKRALGLIDTGLSALDEQEPRQHPGDPARDAAHRRYEEEDAAPFLDEQEPR